MNDKDKAKMEALAENIYGEMSAFFDPTTGEYIEDYEGPLSKNAGNIATAMGAIEERAAKIRRLVGGNA